MPTPSRRRATWAFVTSPLDPRIAAAIRDAFGADADAVEPLSGGRSSATLLQIRVGARRYVVRKINGAPPMHDPRRQLTCTAIASELGITPRLVHADVATGVCITELVDHVSFGTLVRAGKAPIDGLGALLRRLHEAPAFPRFLTIPAAIDALHGALSEGRPPPLPAELTDLVARISTALAGHAAEASCHHDLNPGNILFDGARLWLIDWELAGLADPYQDLAALGVFVLHGDEAMARLHAAYLGRPPAAADVARLELSRSLSFVFYALAFLSAANARGAFTPRPAEGSLPELATVLARTGAGESSALDEPAFGWVLVEQARRRCVTPAFERAMAELGGPR